MFLNQEAANNMSNNMGKYVYINRLKLSHDFTKFHEFVHDHSLMAYTEEKRTGWLRMLGGTVYGMTTSWTHSYIHTLIELKHSIILHAIEVAGNLELLRESVWAIEVVDSLLQAADQSWLVCLSVDPHSYDALEDSRCLSWLQLIPHLKTERFFTESESRDLIKKVNTLDLKLKRMTKKISRNNFNSSKRHSLPI